MPTASTYTYFTLETTALSTAQDDWVVRVELCVQFITKHIKIILHAQAAVFVESVLAYDISCFLMIYEHAV